MIKTIAVKLFPKNQQLYQQCKIFFNNTADKKKNADQIQEEKNLIKLIFVNKDKSQVIVKAKKGQSILEIAQQNNIDLEGACEASLACSTCHVILENKPSLEEEDMLDLTYGLTETSRLGCQVKINEEFQNAIIQLPKATRNFYVDGHKPKPH